MMRFVDLGKQLAAFENDPLYPRQFAFYNTVSDEFVCLGQNGHVWDSWFDILRFCGDESPELLDRLWAISPDWAKEGIHPNWKQNFEDTAKVLANPRACGKWADEFFRPSLIWKRIQEARHGN